MVEWLLMLALAADATIEVQDREACSRPYPHYRHLATLRIQGREYWTTWANLNIGGRGQVVEEWVWTPCGYRSIWAGGNR